MGGVGPPRRPVPFRFRWLREEQPGAAWRGEFERTWPSYRRWFLQDGEAARPDLAACRAALERHMPELVPLWDHLVELADGDPLTARMLSLYRPTPYVTGCSQAVWSRGEPVLVRNYDYHPAGCEGTFLLSAWTGPRVLAAVDGLWGVLDGLNDHGLVVSLAFGGRRAVGDGFGIPLILRYALETCRSTSEAVAALRRVPSHMSYNVSVLDGSGERAVVAVAPDRPTEVLHEDVATNHQAGVEWSRHDRATRSQERERYLNGLLANEALTADDLADRFLRPPLYSRRWDRAFGTLYTSVYRPRAGRVSYRWPSERVDQAFDRYEPGELEVVFG